MYERIAYVSRAAAGVGPRQAYEIIRASHNRNGPLGLSGGLLLLDGFFVQVLEGPRLHVQERLAVIVRDPRHHSLELRLAVGTDRLLFEGEWMALRHDSDVEADLRAGFGYAPGLPAARFTPEQVVFFVQACCAARLQTA